ncbi:MAG: nicotinate-nucleotide--dimethylbenzimidazole phosphoribosyltransferase [Verrucomicrobiae bacterium]
MNLLSQTIRQIAPQDPDFRAAARARLEQLTMPHWALGRLMDMAEDLAGMTRSARPPVARKAVVIMAGDHGVAASGVSQYPQEVTVQMVHNFANGGAGCNALARLAGAQVVVVDAGVAGDLSSLVAEGKVVSKRVAPGTANILTGPAMTREQAILSIEAGIEVAISLGESTDLFATGEMGIANTTPSSAIVAALTGRPAEEITGRGTGLDDEALQNKIAVVKESLRVNRPDPDDVLDVLAKVGGFEIGAIAGLILGAAALKKPVLIDGFITTAGALIAQGLAPGAAQYIIASHRSVEPGHDAALERLGKEPLLSLGLRLGEGTGAALAMNLVEASVRVLTEVATFEEASVSHAKP